MVAAREHGQVGDDIKMVRGNAAEADKAYREDRDTSHKLLVAEAKDKSI